MSGGSRWDSPLWAITSYFNPLGYRRRRKNYRVFRQRLSVPLIAVEHSTSGRFELRPSDAEILIQCGGGGVMWQKERLLNVAIAALPASCRNVAWIDCDIVFGDPAWPEQLERALDRAALVQPFAQARYLQPEARLAALSARDVAYSRPGAARRIAEGLAVEQCLGNYGGPQAGVRAAGLAWAARRELLEQHGLYDACIIGGGGLEVVAAAYGRPEIVADNHRMNSAQAEFYRRWAKPFAAAVAGNVAHLDGEIFHLWHGEPQHRQTNQRHAGLAQFAFDPAIDIALAPSGCWQWSSDKPDLHEFLRQFFATRREDSRSLPPTVPFATKPQALPWNWLTGYRLRAA